jgi:hypothetical protein
MDSHKVPCRYFSSLGSCKFGSSCSFSHDSPRVQSQNSDRGRKVTIDEVSMKRNTEPIDIDKNATTSSDVLQEVKAPNNSLGKQLLSAIRPKNQDLNPVIDGNSDRIQIETDTKNNIKISEMPPMVLQSSVGHHQQIGNTTGTMVSPSQWSAPDVLWVTLAPTKAQHGGGPSPGPPGLVVKSSNYHPPQTQTNLPAPQLQCPPTNPPPPGNLISFHSSIAVKNSLFHGNITKNILLLSLFFLMSELCHLPYRESKS